MVTISLVFTLEDAFKVLSYILVDICIDKDYGALDEYGDSCQYYYNYPEECGGGDDDDFNSNTMCCACKSTVLDYGNKL